MVIGDTSPIEGGVMETRMNKSGVGMEQKNGTATPAIPKIELTQTTGRTNAEASVKIDVRRVNFWYGAKQALFDVSLPMRECQVTALIAPSGCGKSTFLRTLNRMNDLIPRTSTTGEAILDGENCN